MGPLSLDDTNETAANFYDDEPHFFPPLPRNHACAEIFVSGCIPYEASLDDYDSAVTNSFPLSSDDDCDSVVTDSFSLSLDDTNGADSSSEMKIISIPTVETSEGTVTVVNEYVFKDSHYE